MRTCGRIKLKTSRFSCNETRGQTKFGISEETKPATEVQVFLMSSSTLSRQESARLCPGLSNQVSGTTFCRTFDGTKGETKEETKRPVKSTDAGARGKRKVTSDERRLNIRVNLLPEMSPDSSAGNRGAARQRKALRSRFRSPIFSRILRFRRTSAQSADEEQ